MPLVTAGIEGEEMVCLVLHNVTGSPFASKPIEKNHGDFCTKANSAAMHESITEMPGAPIALVIKHVR